MSRTQGEPKLDAVLAAVSYDEARTVSEIAQVACGTEAWSHRTNVRNRVYELERAGLIISDERQPSRWIRNELTP